MDKTLRRFLLACLTTLAIPAIAIDCREVKSSVDAMVCHSSHLIRADENLNRIYGQWIAATSNKQRLRMEQRAWLRENRDTCKDEACLVRVYAKRQAELEQLLLDHRTKSKPTYFCWTTDDDHVAPAVIEMTLGIDTDGQVANEGWIRKYDNTLPIRIRYARVKSSEETEIGRPMAFVQTWNELSGAGNPPHYDILFQSFPRHVSFFPGSQRRAAAEYEPWEAPSDTSCFAAALKERQQRP